MTTPVRTLQAGFTLIELIIVIVVIGVLSVYAAVKNGSSGDYTLHSQAQTMVSDLRHAQALATTLGKSLRISIITGTNGSYSVSCVTPGASPCNSVVNTPMTNPLTGSNFAVALEKDISLSGTATLDINSLGKPAAAAAYVLTAGSTSKNVTVSAVTGFVNAP
ncbi:prepilin-type N-terminal cleavage/methylation domain-containing protein [Ramlibacter sp. WS9]|uniref:prepilin-type N-terminal cleavage/methylation domain-containing protein n=1 Tax=Ramlibacter sp. WS9 TaxID=1882741 RepID=UPI00114141F5|nr:prepilin-type N-terminal cleavage/methylation domain-containing protein [Ramlibacter sp. WS9]ROZ68593.1 prepilin-type N-terminal cleavage/methylation domain-containing protein [Ramlibacter sp. WS9]